MTSSEKEMTTNDSDLNQPRDLEKQAPLPGSEKNHGGIVSLLAVGAGEVYEPHPEKNPRWYQKLLDSGVEENGIKPVPLENRTNTNYSNLFTIFFTCLLCLLPCVSMSFPCGVS
jgi:hypothetical protein